MDGTPLSHRAGSDGLVPGLAARSTEIASEVLPGPPLGFRLGLCLRRSSNLLVGGTDPLAVWALDAVTGERSGAAWTMFFDGRGGTPPTSNREEVTGGLIVKGFAAAQFPPAPPANAPLRWANTATNPVNLPLFAPGQVRQVGGAMKLALNLGKELGRLADTQAPEAGVRFRARCRIPSKSALVSGVAGGSAASRSQAPSCGVSSSGLRCWSRTQRSTAFAKPLLPQPACRLGNAF